MDSFGQLFRSEGETLQHLEEVYSFLVLILAASSVCEWTLHLQALLLSRTIDFICKCSRMLQKKTARCEASQIQVVKYLTLLVAFVRGTDLAFWLVQTSSTVFVRVETFNVQFRMGFRLRLGSFHVYEIPHKGRNINTRAHIPALPAAPQSVTSSHHRSLWRKEKRTYGVGDFSAKWEHLQKKV